MNNTHVNIILFDNDELTEKLIDDYAKELQIEYKINSYAQYDKSVITENKDFKFIFISTDLKTEKVMEDIKELSQDSNNVFFLLSNEPDTDLYVRSLRVGVKEFLLKPLIRKDFLKAVKNHYSVNLQIEDSKSRAKIISVTSAEIGCGKTFFSINIARELAGITKEKVLLIDFNNNLNNVSFSLDIDPAYDTNHFLQNTRQDNYVEIFSQVYRFKNSSLYIISNGLYTGTDDTIRVSNIREFFSMAKKYYKFIVVDVNQSVSELSKLLYDESDIILYLISPNITACEKNKKYLNNELLSRKFKVILNKFKTKDEAKLNDIETAIGYDILEKIPMNLTVSVSPTNRGKTIREVSPDSDIVKSYNKIAGYLIHRV